MERNIRRLFPSFSSFAPSPFVRRREEIKREREKRLVRVKRGEEQRLVFAGAAAIPVSPLGRSPVPCSSLSLSPWPDSMDRISIKQSLNTILLRLPPFSFSAHPFSGSLLYRATVSRLRRPVARAIRRETSHSSFRPASTVGDVVLRGLASGDSRICSVGRGKGATDPFDGH